MPLTLKIISFKGQPYPEGQDVLFDSKGGTIGRSGTNILVLADQENIISRRHAAIQFENGTYQIIDSSLAGTYIDDAIEPINNSNAHLVDGMIIRIGDYTIAVSISDEQSPDSSTLEEDPFLYSAPQEPEPSGSFSIKQDNPFADAPYSETDNNELLKASESDFDNALLTNELEQSLASDLSTPDDISNAEKGSLLEQLSSKIDNASSRQTNSLLDPLGDHEKPVEKGILDENVSSLNDSFTPAQPVEKKSTPDQDEIPDDFNFEDLFSAGGVERNQQPDNQSLEEKIDSGANHEIVAKTVNEDIKSESVRPVQSAQSSENENAQLLLAFLRGAQIDQRNIDFTNPVEKMTRIGAMFRQFAESTVSVLRNRAEFKSLFRVSVTTIKKADNNPLKFAVTTDDVLKHIINDGQGGFKKSVESIDEGFSDLLNHQLAMQAGIQASLNEILRQFDPQFIARQYEEGIVLQKKAKCWDKYTEDYASLSESAIDGFFGDAFSEAYERQMKQLKR